MFFERNDFLNIFMICTCYRNIKENSYIALDLIIIILTTKLSDIFEYIFEYVFVFVFERKFLTGIRNRIRILRFFFIVFVFKPF